MINELAQRIWSHAQFHHEAGELRSRALGARYLETASAVFDTDVLRRLLRSATVLSASDQRKHREIAYQIATAASEAQTDDLDAIGYVLLIVLSRLGNFPALNYAKRRFSVSEERLPVRMVAESAERTDANSIRVRDNSIALTDFQHDLWTALNTGESIGISAPTSAGKSFILQTYAKKLLTEQLVDNVALPCSDESAHQPGGGRSVGLVAGGST